MRIPGNYFVTEDNDGNMRAVVYQKLFVGKDDEKPDADAYALFGTVGNAVVIVQKFDDQNAANRELLRRCGVSDIMLAAMELSKDTDENTKWHHEHGKT